MVYTPFILSVSMSDNINVLYNDLLIFNIKWTINKSFMLNPSLGQVKLYILPRSYIISYGYDLTGAIHSLEMWKWEFDVNEICLREINIIDEISFILLKNLTVSLFSYCCANLCYILMSFVQEWLVDKMQWFEGVHQTRGQLPGDYLEYTRVSSLKS